MPEPIRYAGSLNAKKEAIAAAIPGANPQSVALNPTGIRKISATVVLLTCSSRVKITIVPLVRSDNPSASRDAAGAGRFDVWRER